MVRPIVLFSLNPQQERALRDAARAPSTPQRVVQRCRVLLHRGAGLSQAEAGRRERLARNKVGQWERRFAAQELAGLEDKPGRGRKSMLDADKTARVLAEVTRPPKGLVRWTVRAMARHAGVSIGAVHGLWRANDLKPHRTRTFKLSRDPQFEPKFWDVIGLYLDPPQKARRHYVMASRERDTSSFASGWKSSGAASRGQRPLFFPCGSLSSRIHDQARQAASRQTDSVFHRAAHAAPARRKGRRIRCAAHGMPGHQASSFARSAAVRAGSAPARLLASSGSAATW